MSVRRVPPGGGIAIGIVLGLLMWATFFALAHAQTAAPKQSFFVYVDTTGIAPVGPPGIYITWVFAKASPNALPSSGVLVAWDCLTRPRLVKRLAQVVYQLTTDSTGVTGSIMEVDRPWQVVTDERLADLVCKIGPTHIVKPKVQSPYRDA